VLRIRIGSGFNQVSGSQFGIRIQIQIQEGKNNPQKLKKFGNFLFNSDGRSLLYAESFSCSLDFLYEGLGISKSQFLIKKIYKKIFLEPTTSFSATAHRTCDGGQTPME
jgi:hypothetical protein